MKKHSFLFLLLTCGVLLMGCLKVQDCIGGEAACTREIINNRNVVDENIKLSGYSSNLTYDSPFVPGNIPEDFSGDIVELKDYGITTKLGEIIEHPENIYYFTGTEPVVIRDLKHGIDILLSKDFSKYFPRIFIYHDADVFSEGLGISALVDGKYTDFNGFTSIAITADKNDSEDIPGHFEFFGAGYLGKNNKYTFFLVDSGAMIKKLFYKDYKDYSEYLNKLFLGFRIFNV